MELIQKLTTNLEIADTFASEYATLVAMGYRSDLVETAINDDQERSITLQGKNTLAAYVAAKLEVLAALKSGNLVANGIAIESAVTLEQSDLIDSDLFHVKWRSALKSDRRNMTPLDWADLKPRIDVSNETGFGAFSTFFVNLHTGTSWCGVLLDFDEIRQQWQTEPLGSPSRDKAEEIRRIADEVCHPGMRAQNRNDAIKKKYLQKFKEPVGDTVIKDALRGTNYISRRKK